MPSTIVRSAQKTGLVLLESSCSVAEDGMVTVNAEFLAPSTKNTSGFDLDAPWPESIALPVGLPSLQGGPFVLTRNINKKHGLVFISATYVSAVSPPRFVTTFTTETKSFNGQAESAAGSIGVLAFDYTCETESLSFCLIGLGFYNLQPSAKVLRQFNFQRSGFSFLVKPIEQKTIEQSETIVGRVRRIQRKSNLTIEQE